MALAIVKYLHLQGEVRTQTHSMSILPVPFDVLGFLAFLTSLASALALADFFLGTGAFAPGIVCLPAIL